MMKNSQKYHNKTSIALEGMEDDTYIVELISRSSRKTKHIFYPSTLSEITVHRDSLAVVKYYFSNREVFSYHYYNNKELWNLVLRYPKMNNDTIYNNNNLINLTFLFLLTQESIVNNLNFIISTTVIATYSVFSHTYFQKGNT